MDDTGAAVESNRAAVDRFIEACAQADGVWDVPRAPGKWSPSQLVEHVARSLEAAGDIYAGRPSSLPKLPRFLHPLTRGLLFNRVIKKAAFPKARTNKAMDPASGPPTADEGARRLNAAFAVFEKELRARAASSPDVHTSAFGSVRVTAYARFIELHTLHHLKQMPEA